MSEKNLTFAAEEAFFGRFDSAFTGLSVKCKPAPEPDALGYTRMPEKKSDGTPDAEIFIARDHPVMEKIPQEMRSLFRMGVNVHETLHQIFTDFTTHEKICKTVKKKDQNIFHTIVNIYEDPSIENFAPQVFGGEALIALYYTIKTIYEQAPEISPDEPDPMQVLNAFIMLGDRGAVKGIDNMSEKASDVFAKMLPLFEQCISEPNGCERIKIAHKAYKIFVKEFPTPELPTVYMMSGSGSGESGEADGHETSVTKGVKALVEKFADDKSKSDKGTKEESSKDGSDKKETGEAGGEGDKKKKGKEKSSAPSGTSSSVELSEANGDGHASKITSGATSATKPGKKLEDDLSEDDLNEAAKKIEASVKDEEKKISDSEKEEKSDTSEMPSISAESLGGGCEKHEVIRERIPESRLADKRTEYEGVVKKYNSDIELITKKLSKIVATVPSRKTHSRKGTVDIERYKNPAYTGVRIFDKKTKEERHDVAIEVLVDLSGSMRSCGRYRYAREAAIVLAEVCGKLKVPCCIIGYTGDVTSRYSVQHHIYTTWANKKQDRISLMNINAYNENRDGSSIRYGTKVLEERSEKNKLLIVISDGEPCAVNYYGDEAIRDTKLAIRKAKKKNLDVLGICIDDYADAKLKVMYEGNYLCVKDLTNLPAQLIKKVERISAKW